MVEALRGDSTLTYTQVTALERVPVLCVLAVLGDRLARHSERPQSLPGMPGRTGNRSPRETKRKPRKTTRRPGRRG